MENELSNIKIQLTVENATCVCCVEDDGLIHLYVDGENSCASPFEGDKNSIMDVALAADYIIDNCF